MAGTSAGRHAEGWEWARIQQEACPQCGHCAASVAPVHLGRLALGAADGWRRFLMTEDPDTLRACPAPGIWSPLEYAAHARDMLRVFGERILRTVAEDNPDLPWFDHDRAAAAGRYNELEPAALADDLVAEARAFAAVVDERAPDDWDRTAIRDGTDRFTVAGLARFALHEVHHHLFDANGALRR
ncbi:MAG: DinB family protein [Actinomycetota bacterium]|nr:DinB family protein [Actinomycetota bacterium]